METDVFCMPRNVMEKKIAAMEVMKWLTAVNIIVANVLEFPKKLLARIITLIYRIILSLEDIGHPTFTTIRCDAEEEGASADDFCIKIDYPNDHEHDFARMKRDDDYNLLYEGSLKKETDVKLTLTLPDEDEDPPETYTTVKIIFLLIALA